MHGGGLDYNFVYAMCMLNYAMILHVHPRGGSRNLKKGGGGYGKGWCLFGRAKHPHC